MLTSSSDHDGATELTAAIYSSVCDSVFGPRSSHYSAGVVDTTTDVIIGLFISSKALSTGYWKFESEENSFEVSRYFIAITGFCSAR